MKIIIFGLGSMGKRRARCLQELEAKQDIFLKCDIVGFDINPNRVEEAKRQNIEATTDFTALSLSKADAYFICTPPDQHEIYLEYALAFKKPCFVEASVILGKLEKIYEVAQAQGIFIAPSCTLLFHPAIMLLQEIITSQQFGKVTNFSYHCGQYLPDWHPWESVKDFYVSNYITGGCREIVPFELTWITRCFGFPQNVIALYGQTMDVGAKIDDTYAISLQFKNSFGVMLIDVTSRYAIRSLILNFENGQIHWRWDKNYLNIFNVVTQQWEKRYFESKASAKGYNKNISEEMYINEVAAFLNGIKDPEHYPNDLIKDIKILKLLNKLEKEVNCELIS